MSTSQPDNVKQEITNDKIVSSSEIKNPSLSPQLSSSSIKYPQIQIPCTTQTSPEQNSKSFRNRMLSPQTSKQKIESMLEKMELNTKYFPSKAHVCKGESSERINFFSPKHSNSPIINYYAGISPTSTNGNMLPYYSPEHEVPFYQCQINPSNYGQNYNFSPSAIFNKGTARHYSHSSVGTNNNVEVPHKTLQEKIEGNFNDGNPSATNTSTHHDKQGDDSEENQELYMLSFNSDDANEFDDEDLDLKEVTKETSNEEKEMEKSIGFKISISEEGDISHDFLSSGINNNKIHQIQNTSSKTIPELHKTENTLTSTAPIQQKKETTQLDQKPVINYSSNYINNSYYNNINQIPQYIPKSSSSHPSYQPPTTKPKTITASNLITTTTANNKKIKRIDPQTYLNESYEYLAHNIYPLAKDQAGCRFLQKKLEDEPQIATSFFYPAILPYVLTLVKDTFGNYLIQKLCYTLSPEQILQLLKILSTNILDIGANSHGTRVIQHIINFLKTPELIHYFISIIQPYVISLLKELNGTHIIQKFNTDYPHYSNVINKIVIDNCESLATHRHGCCVLQKYLDSPDEEMKKQLINSLIEKCLVLIIDQFGNYVIQSVLLLNDVEASNAIASKLVENAAYYSKHKYSSNVVEKCFDFCDDNARKELIKVLSKAEVMNDLILDEHGNYVIQKVLACADLKTQNEMLQNIAPILNKLKNLNFGERIISRLLVSYPQMNSMINGKKYNKGRYNKKKGNMGNTNNKQKYK